MKIYLAGIESTYAENIPLLKGSYTLMSFYSYNKRGMEIVKMSKSFLLDSGAFSFMRGKNDTNVNWDEYIEKYAEFINDNHIKNFFELDIDNVVGYEKVKKYRKKLEALTNKQCIPVWHRSRGAKEWLAMADEYSYIAIGGIVSKEIKPAQYDIFPAMITAAHQRGARVHGLGFTDTRQLKKIHFDSVDSTSWLCGRYGHYYVNEHNVLVQKHRPEKKRSIGDKIQKHNLKKWLEYQKYAEVNL